MLPFFSPAYAPPCVLVRQGWELGIVTARVRGSSNAREGLSRLSRHVNWPIDLSTATFRKAQHNFDSSSNGSDQYGMFSRL